MEYIIHEVLEGPWGVAESEGHNLVLVEAIATPEGGLPLFSWRNSEAVVPISYVQFGDVFRSLDLVEDLVDEREGVPILDGDFIEPSVVDT